MASKSNKTYTVMVVPERSSQVRRWIVPHRALVYVMLGVAGFVAVSSFMFVHYAFVIGEASQNRVLKSENVALKARLRMMQDEVARIDTTLQRIDQFSAKVRAITQLNDPERNLAIGPLDEPSGNGQVLYAPGERIDYDSELMDSQLAARMIDAKLEQVGLDAMREEKSMRELHDFFVDHPDLLATMPSIRPTASKLLTSSFGERTDPYTNHRVMHKGLDFAADHGAEIHAPADGTVVFAGNRGGYGQALVLDHGFGIQTHFGHLSEFRVQMGQHVDRGQLIGLVGNTGRSTGAHLHYEVRFHGIPQDPSRYIFE